MYKYVLNSVVKISVMFAKYFEYYTIILGGRFLCTRCRCSHVVVIKRVILCRIRGIMWMSVNNY